MAEQTSAPRPTNFASVYVPLDSWIYPAMERLIGGGYIDTAFLGLRPWTRMSCAHMLIEMNQKVEYHADLPSEIWQLQEVARCGVCARDRDLGGTPDGIDPTGFGLYPRNGHCRQAGQRQLSLRADADQRLRPSLLAGRATTSPASAPAPTMAASRSMWMANISTRRRFPAYPLSVRQVIAKVDLNPLQPPTPFVDQSISAARIPTPRMKYAGLDLSVGKQSMWWGPSEGGALLMSDNATPFWMIADQSHGADLHSRCCRSSWAHSRRTTSSARSPDTSFPPGPYIFGQKVSFKPTENLEFGFTRDDVFGGAGTRAHDLRLVLELLSPASTTCRPR